MRGLAAIAGADEGPPIVPESGWTAWLVSLAAAAMAFLAVATLAAGLAASGLAAEWRSDLEGTATVRVPPGDEGALARVLEVLRQTPGIAEARPLGREEQAALLAPWLGEGAALSELPVPRLVDVTLDGRGPDPAPLAATLAEAGPGTVYDNHSGWRGPLLEAAGAVQRLAFAAAALVLLGGAGIVALAARASLAGNREIVRVIRLIGGEDRFIVATFVRPLVWRTGLGALAGAALAAVALALLPDTGREVGLDLAPGATGLVLFVVLVPLAAAAVASATARLSVRAALRALP